MKENKLSFQDYLRKAQEKLITSNKSQNTEKVVCQIIKHKASK